MTSLLRSYALMVKWQAISHKPMLIFSVAIQILMTVAFIIGISYIFPDITPAVAKFLTTGALTLVLLTIGLVATAQKVAMDRTEGTFDYIWSLPVKRMVYVMADATTWIFVAIPGIVSALVIGTVYHNFSLQVSPLVVPAFLLIILTAVFIGYSVGFGVPDPQMAALAANVLIFFIMFFSPLIFPVEQLPDWLAAAHRVLPVKYMADLMRGTLTDIDVNLGLAFGVIGLWFVAAFTGTYLLVSRRR